MFWLLEGFLLLAWKAPTCNRLARGTVAGEGEDLGRWVELLPGVLITEVLCCSAAGIGVWAGGWEAGMVSFL